MPEAARELTFHLKQNHGGWNSDDLHDQQPRPLPPLGHRRPPNPVADPLPQRVREILADPARAAHARRRSPRVFCYWRTTVPEWKEANDRIEALWKQHPDGTTHAGPRRRATSRGRRSLLKRGDFLKPGRAGRRRACRRSCIRCRRTPPPTRLTLRAVAGRPRSRRRPRASFVNRVWQAYFGTGLVATQRGLRHRRASRRRIPSCSTGWPSSSWTSGWSLKELHRLIVTSADLPAVVARSRPSCSRRTRTTGSWPAGRGFGSRARSSATSRSRPAAC